MTVPLRPSLRRVGLDACAAALHAESDLVVLAGGEGARRLWTAVRACGDGGGHDPRVEVHGDDAGAVALGAAAAGERVALLASGPEWTSRVAPSLRALARAGLGALVVSPAHGEERGGALPEDSLRDVIRLLDAPVGIELAASPAELGARTIALGRRARALARPWALAFSLERVGLAASRDDAASDHEPRGAVTLLGDPDADQVVLGAGEDLEDLLARAARCGGSRLRAVRVERVRPGVIDALAEALHGAARVTVVEAFPDPMLDEGWLTTRAHRATAGRSAVRAVVRLRDAEDSAAYEDDETRGLALMPLEVRRRLDLAGLHVSLDAWKAMDLVTRAALRAAPDDALDAFATMTRAACEGVSRPAREVAPRDRPWDAPEGFARVRDRAREAGVALDAIAFHALHPPHRFALHHLADPKRESERFRAALTALLAAAP